jgi:hypothetical protein
VVLTPVLNGKSELKIVLNDKVVPSAEENAFENKVPFLINKSIFGVKALLDSLKI